MLLNGEVLLHRSQLRFHYRGKKKCRRYRKPLLFAAHSQAFPDRDHSSNADDLLEPLPFVTDTTTNNRLFKRLEWVLVEGCMTDVTFRVPLRDARHERVFLLGDSREFGKWQLEDAFPLRWTPGDVWIGQLRLHAGTYEFKIIRVRDDKEDRETGENRVLVIDERPSTGSEMEITMEFGETRFSDTLKTIRETVVLGANGDELFRVSGELHRLVEIEDVFRTQTKRELSSSPSDPIGLEETPVEEESSERTPTPNEQTPDAISIAEYFESVLLLGKDDIESLFQEYPSLGLKSVKLEVKPWVDYLRQRVGVPYSQIGTLIKKNTKLLSVPMEELAPVVEFLRHDIGMSMKQLLRFCELSCIWHYQKFEEEFKPKIENFRRVTGMKNSGLGRVLSGRARVLSFSDTKLHQRFEGLKVLLSLSKKKCVDLVAQDPRLLERNPRTISKRIEYFTKELNRSIDEIVADPQALAYSFDDRVKKRFDCLERFGIPHSAYSLYQILHPSDEAFESFIQRHLEN